MLYFFEFLFFLFSSVFKRLPRKKVEIEETLDVKGNYRKITRKYR